AWLEAEVSWFVTNTQGVCLAADRVERVKRDAKVVVDVGPSRVVARRDPSRATEGWRGSPRLDLDRRDGLRARLTPLLEERRDAEHRDGRDDEPRTGELDRLGPRLAEREGQPVRGEHAGEDARGAVHGHAVGVLALVEQD